MSPMYIDLIIHLLTLVLIGLASLLIYKSIELWTRVLLTTSFKNSLLYRLKIIPFYFYFIPVSPHQDHGASYKTVFNGLIQAVVFTAGLIGLLLVSVNV